MNDKFERFKIIEYEMFKLELGDFSHDFISYDCGIYWDNVYDIYDHQFEDDWTDEKFKKFNITKE